MPNAWIEVGEPKRDVITYLTVLAYLIVGWSAVKGVVDSPDSFLITTTESEWVFYLYALGLGLAAFAGVVSSWQGFRKGEAYAAFMFSGMVGLHGFSIIIGSYVDGGSSGYLGWRMIGGCLISVVYGMHLRRLATATANVRRDLGEEDD